MDTSNAFDLRLSAEMAKVHQQAGLYKVSKKKELSLPRGHGWCIYFHCIRFLYCRHNRACPCNRPGKTGRRRVLLAGPRRGGGLWRRFVHLDSIDGDRKSQRANKLATVNYQLDILYFGNLVGALFFVALIWFCRAISEWQWSLGTECLYKPPSHKMHHTFVEAVCLGTLCNLIGMSGCVDELFGHTLTDKIMAMLLPIGMFVASSFEHSIANMFLIPLSICYWLFCRRRILDQHSRQPRNIFRH